MFESTIYFKNIFKTVSDFTTFVNSLPLSFSDTTNFFIPETYQLLMNKFANSNIAYETVGGFKRMFGNTLADFFEMERFNVQNIAKIYQLTNDDINTLNTAFNTVANNNNSTAETPLNIPLDFVSQQLASKVNGNKFTQFYQLVRTYLRKDYEEYLNNFNKHFIRVFPYKVYLYKTLEEN